MKSTVLDARELAQQITLTVHIRRLKEWEIRLWIAALLFRLGAWVAGFDIEFEEEG